MVTVNDKSKERLRKLNSLLVTKLEGNFSVNVYQDEVSEDEESSYHYFIFETGGYTKAGNHALNQDVLVRYYSENRDDLDERMLDIITVLESINYNFQSSTKTAIQKGDMDEYVDEVEIQLTRSVKYGC